MSRTGVRVLLRGAAFIACAGACFAACACLSACDSGQDSGSIFGTQADRDQASLSIKDEMDSQESTDLDSDG